MKRRSLVFGSLIVAGVIATAAWFGWRYANTPIAPTFPFDQMEPGVSEKISKARDAALHHPHAGEPWGELGLAAAANGYYDEAIVCFGYAERLDPADPRWPYLHGYWIKDGRPGEPIALWRRALDCSCSPEQRGAILFRLALALIEAGANDEAERHLRDLQNIEGVSARVHLGLGLLAMARDDASGARAHLAEVLGHPCARKVANAHLATLAAAAQDAALGRFYQQQAAQLPPDAAWPDVFVQEMESHSVNRDQRVREAADLESAGRLPEAIAILRQTIATTPDASAYLALGIALTKVHQFEEAEAALTTALRLDPHQMYAHHFLATILFVKAEKLHAEPSGRERAQELFRQVVAAEDQALAIKAQDSFAHVTRGRALRYLGRTEEALKNLRVAALLRPGVSELELTLGEALAEAGHFPEALSHLEDAVRFAAPGDDRPGIALKKWRARATAAP